MNKRTARVIALTVFIIDCGLPVAHVVLCDFDGDGMSDAFCVTRTDPAWIVVARRKGEGEGFAAPVGCELPRGCDGIILNPTPAGTHALVLAGGGTLARRYDDCGPLPAKAGREAAGPGIVGFAADLDGDGTGDPVLPGDSGFEIALSGSKRRVPVTPPVTRTRDAGLRGLVAARSRFPLVPFETLKAGEPPRPCFFANGTLSALQGDLTSGFGPALDAVMTLPARADAALERTEARLVDIAGSRHVLLVRTRSQGAALPQVRTELLFHDLAADDPGRAVQAILLPGVLSSGPDVRDVDGDGRPDLFLSVFGDELGQQVRRRITGKVRLEYFLYRGSASGPPFCRAPDFTEADGVPEPLFVDWDRRHRLVLAEDWTGDGLPDLIQISATEGTTRVAVRSGRIQDGKSGFTEPVAFVEKDVSVLTHVAWRLSAREPAILCRTATGVAIFARQP